MYQNNRFKAGCFALVVEAESPEGDDVGVAKFYVVFYDIAFGCGFNLLLSLFLSSDFKCGSVYFKVGNLAAHHIVVHSHLIHEESFP